MKKTTIFALFASLFLIAILASVSAEAPFNHRYQGYSSADSNTYSEKWEFKEDVLGKDKSFSLTYTNTLPKDNYVEVHNSPYTYSTYSSSSYSPYKSYSALSSRSQERVLLEAFKTFQADSARRDIIRANAKRPSYYVSFSYYPRYSYYTPTYRYYY